MHIYHYYLFTSSTMCTRTHTHTLFWCLDGLPLETPSLLEAQTCKAVLAVT